MMGLPPPRCFRTGVVWCWLPVRLSPSCHEARAGDHGPGPGQRRGWCRQKRQPRPVPVVSDGLWSCFPGSFSGPLEGLVFPCCHGDSAGVAAGPRAAVRAVRAVRKACPEGGFFAPFARRFPVRRGAPETPGGVVFRRAAENGPVQKKCEGVSSYGLWGLHARLCAMNVRSERMSVSARFTDTAQLGRVCKKSVRPSGRGVQGGSLSKKLKLN